MRCERTAGRRVLVAMSGGVDSSVAAALLLEAGYEPIGVTMRLSSTGREAEAARPVEDARRVAEALGISHHVMDFRAAFSERVVRYFLDEYAAGRTPNPCVACNRHIKFGALLRKAAELGADFLSTGHYARVARDAAGGFHLLKGLDERKDQSYVLYHLTQASLRRVLLPIGEYEKSAVRRLAASFSLPVADKAESQEICFVPNDDYAAFLRRERPEALAPGDIVDTAGRALGRHAGVPLYTIGQRRGLGVAAPLPLYVVRLDAARREVVVGGARDVFSGGLVADDLSWTASAPPSSFRAEVKVRYGRRSGAADVRLLPDGRVEAHFDEPQRAVTPGQSAVFYRDGEVLGGGVIERALP